MCLRSKLRALVPALAMVVLASVAAASVELGQGPDSGSPFVDAPLDLEALKAPPDSAFEILMISIGVFLLVPITAAAFIALARLRNLEETLAKELRSLREEIVVEDDGPSDGGVDVRVVAEEAAARIEAAMAEVSARLEIALSAAVEARTDSPQEDTDRIVRALDAACAAQAASSKETIDRLEAVATAIREAGASPEVAAIATQAAAAPERVGLPAVLDRVETRLAALGYTAVQVVTPRDEITDEVLRSGALLVEAKRSGAVHKGRVVLEDGAPVDVQLQPSHGMFP